MTLKVTEMASISPYTFQIDNGELSIVDELGENDGPCEILNLNSQDTAEFATWLYNKTRTVGVSTFIGPNNRSMKDEMIDRLNNSKPLAGIGVTVQQFPAVKGDETLGARKAQQTVTFNGVEVPEPGMESSDGRQKIVMEEVVDLSAMAKKYAPGNVQFSKP